jgi:hypothetical protein
MFQLREQQADIFGHWFLTYVYHSDAISTNPNMWNGCISWFLSFYYVPPNTVVKLREKKLNDYTGLWLKKNINTEGVFFMCEGYMELAPLVAIHCTNMAVVKKSRRLWLNTSSCLRLAVNAFSFFNLDYRYIVCCVVLWTCKVMVVWTLQTVFVIPVASL